MPDAAPQGQSSSRKRVFVGIAVAAIIAIVVVIFLLTRGCDSPPPTVARGFDYFHAKAEELGRDPDKVAAFVAGDIKTLGPDSGNVKGPLATLWNGAGTEKEKAQLAAVLTACCDPVKESADAWREAAEGAKLSVMLEVNFGGKVSSTPVIEQSCGLFAGAGHSLEIGDDAKARLIIRPYGAQPVTQEIDAKEADWAQLRFTLTGADATPREIVRELWHKDNRTGPTFGIPGDRHDFIVLPSRVTKFVREKEELRLKETKRENEPDAKAYLNLLDYCLQSDWMLAGIEKQNGVTARFDLPRILILSRYNLPDFVGGPAHALDLRLNYTGFDGEKIAAYSSAQTRGFTEAGLETKWLAEFAKSPCTSAHDVITALREDYPDEPARRLQAVLDALAAAKNEPEGTRLTFAAGNPAAKDAARAEITLDKLADGKWSVRSGALNAALVADLQKNPDMPAMPIKDGRIDGATDSHERLALLVEVGLMATDIKPQTGPRYVLQTRLASAQPSLVAVGATFKFQWGEGETAVDQQVEVTACGHALTLGAFVQSGVRPVRGQRTISAKALDNATLHNPWYAQGSDAQDNATSFVVSRKVYAALKAGKACEFALEGRYASQDDAAEGKPRPITWRGQIEPLGEGVLKTRINNREESIKVLRCKAGDREMAIFDDERWPVGMADKLLEINTSIRGRVVDTGGTPIGGASITVDGARVESAFDGSFKFPPRAAGSYAKVKATIQRGSDPLGEVEIDLSAPGLSEVTVTVPRPLKDLVFIHPSDRKQLDALPLSAQVKRHANLAFDAGRCVLIPNRMIYVGQDEEIAFYSFDPATGENIGVMETGLNGSSQAMKSAWKDAAKKVAKEAWKEKKDIAEGGLPPIHMLRGALVAWWGYAAYRLEGSSNLEAVMRLINDMDYWEANSNFFSQAEKAVGGRAGEEVRKRLGGAVGGNMDGGAAAVAFKCGYLGALGFMAAFMESRGMEDD